MTTTVFSEEFFAQVEADLRSKFLGLDRKVPHQGEKGGVRERRIRGFLSSALPEQVGVGHGHIVDSQGQLSTQTDIVLYDAERGVALRIDEDYAQFFCEFVYAAIEVKSELSASYAAKPKNRGTLFDCMSATTQLKSLPRKSPLLSAVFAYQTGWREDPAGQVISWFARLHGRYHQIPPDIMCVLDPGFVIIPSNPTGYWRAEDREFPVILKNPLLYFLSRMQRYLPASLIQPGSADSDLWTEYTKFISGQAYARIYRVE